ncbi:hypothetical protein MGSAQ_002503, partial [marine sediment metagenome]
HRCRNKARLAGVFYHASNAGKG